MRALSWILCLWLLSQSPVSWSNDLIERFSAVPSTWDARVSLDGKHVALGCARREAPAVCVYELDNTSKPPIVLHAPAEHLLEYFRWLDNGWVLMRVRKSVYDRGRHRWLGQVDDVITNIFTQRIASLGGGLEVASIPGNPPGVVVFRTGEGMARIDLASNEVKHKQLFQPFTYKRWTLNAWYNERGEQVLMVSTERTNEKLFVIRDEAQPEVTLDTVITKTSFFWEPLLVGFTDGGNKLATLGHFDDRLQLQLFDSATGKPLPRDPALDRPGLQGWIKDVASDELVGLRYVDGLPRQQFLDVKLERIRTTVTKALPGMSVELLSWSNDRSFATIRAAVAGKPPTFYLFDLKQGSLSPLGAADATDLPATRTTTIEYAARDGLKIEAFLTLPADKQAAQGPLPLLLMPHDGPYGRDDASYHWMVEYFAQRGYAVLRPNYRGSTGYGKSFAEKGFGEFGDAIINDIIDGARSVIASGLVDENRVCAIGEGYGGYAALMSGLRQSSLIKCVIAVNTISDAVTVLGDTLKFHSTRSTLFEHWENYLGGRYHDDAAAAAISPARSADKMRPPVLLLHDSRTHGSPVTQSRHLKERMDLYDRDAKLVEFEAGDAQLVTPQARRVILTESDAFLQKHLKPK